MQFEETKGSIVLPTTIVTAYPSITTSAVFPGMETNDAVDTNNQNIIAAGGAIGGVLLTTMIVVILIILLVMITTRRWVLQLIIYPVSFANFIFIVTREAKIIRKRN